MPASLPSYALYGEHGRTQATDWLHCETIAERSQRHDWEIRPHRHEALFQILHIQRGSATAWLDGRQARLTGPCVLLAPPLVPHGFRFAPDIDGTVLTVLDTHFNRLLAAVPTLAGVLAQPQHWGWAAADVPPGEAAGHAPAAAAAVAAAVAALRAEFFGTAPWRDLALDAALLQLAVTLGRVAPAVVAPPLAGTARALSHVRRFRALVESQFRQQPGLAALANVLGITATQLNRVCHQVLGHSALGVLHARLVLEAQRDLAYTTLSIKQIALGLGFGDAGYFTRFFQRHTGHTPTAWRALAAR
jgi:AraC family transcriptional activator of pobA